MARHEARDEHGELIVGATAFGGRHNATMMNDQTLSWFHDELAWLTTPVDELPPTGIGDTTPLPAVRDEGEPGQVTITGTLFDEAPSEDTTEIPAVADEQAHAREVAVGARDRVLDPRDPTELERVLAALRRL